MSGVTRVGVFCTAPYLDDWAIPEGSGHPSFRSRKRGTADEGARLDALQQALWAKAMEGDLPAAAAVVRIIQTRCRLYGLAGVPRTLARRNHERSSRHPRECRSFAPQGAARFIPSVSALTQSLSVRAGLAAGTDRAARG